MSGNKPKRTFYPMDKFPFDRLCLDTVEKGRNVGDDWTHWSFFLKGEKDATRREEFGINRYPRQNSGSIAYYMKEGNPKPSFYMHHEVQSDWWRKDAQGNVLRQRNAAGDAVEKFWNAFYDRMIELLEQVPMKDRILAMGAKVAKKALREAISHPLRWQKYPDDHENAGDEDHDKSQQLKLNLWTKDLSRPGKGANSKKWQQKRDALQQQQQQQQQPDQEDTEGASEIVIPGTEIMLLTNVYDLTSDKANPNGEKAKNYNQVKRFMSSKSPHPNTNPRYSRMTTMVQLLAPTLTFKRADDADGELKIKPRDLYVLTCSSSNYSTTLQSDVLADLKRERDEERQAQGITDEDDNDDEGNATQHGEKKARNNDGSVRFTLAAGDKAAASAEPNAMQDEAAERDRIEQERLIQLAESHVPDAPSFGPPVGGGARGKGKKF